MPPTVLNRRESRRVDHLAIAKYGLSGLVLMENAGRGAADVLCSRGIAGPVAVCCGRGNNAGDGFVIARHLELRGHSVRVLLWADPADLSGDAAANYAVLEKSGTPIVHFGAAHNAGRLAVELAGAAWIVDALLGTGAAGEPRPPFDAVIDQLNASGVPILAVDLPSGLDCDSGEPAGHTVRAQVTCTFVAGKPGFYVSSAAPYVGQLHVLDIGAPRQVIEDALREEGPSVG